MGLAGKNTQTVPGEPGVVITVNTVPGRLPESFGLRVPPWRREGNVGRLRAR